MTNKLLINSQLEKLDVINTEILDECGFGQFRFFKAKKTVNCPVHGEVTFNCVVTPSEQKEGGQSKAVCFTCSNEIAEAKQQWEFNQEWKASHRNAELPEHLKATRFSDFKATSERQEKIIKFLADYTTKFAKGEFKTLPNVIFIGGTGTGKTMLSGCVINEIFAIAYKNKNTASARFIRSSQITQGCWTARQDRDSTEEDFIRTFAYKGLLVIDDLGENDTSGNSEWAKRDRERLSEIIDGRYKKLPTIITSNMQIEQIEEFLGDRAFDRLQERLVIIRCDWESHRQQNRVVMEL